MTEELKTIDTVDTSPFKRMVMTIGELPTSFVDSMSYYELLAWLCNYLKNTVIPTVNNNAEAVEELQTLFIELKTFVDDYFDNLDVQEEINNKLDSMAEAGTLQEIISEYLNSTALFGFDTVADMKAATNLINGSFAKTLGYHTKNDGGAATYKIRTITNDDDVDEMLIVEIGDSSNQLVAELIMGDSVCPEMLGAYGDATHDDTTPIAKAVTLNTKIVMSKNYLISSNIRIGDIDNLDIDAEKATITYNGDSDDYAFLIQHLNGGNVKFGKIESNGGCIKFYSKLGVADRVQYFKLKFNHLRASTTMPCIYAKSELDGWLNEIQIDGGYFTRGSYGLYMTNQKSTDGGLGAWKINNLGFEGTTNNIHMDASNGTYQHGHFFNNIRYVEHTTSKLFETTGRMDSITMVSWGVLDLARLDCQWNRLFNFKLLCPIVETGTYNVIADGVYYNNNRTRYIYNRSTWALPTKNTTNVSSGVIMFGKEGNTCIITCRDLVTLTASGNLIDVLPFKPKEQVSALLTNSNGSKLMRIYVNTSGELKFSGNSADIGTSFQGEIVYFTETDIVSNA